MTKAEEICQKISPSLNPEFFEGKRDLGEFEDLLKLLRDRGDLTKDEYQYTRKNPRHVLLGLRLYSLIKEVYDPRNTPTVFIQVSSLLAIRLVREGKVKTLEEAANVLADQMHQTLGASITSYYTADTIGEKIRELKDDIARVYPENDVKEIQRCIMKTKDDIFETIGMSAILHEMNQYVRELEKSGLPEYYDILDVLEKWAKRSDST